MQKYSLLKIDGYVVLMSAVRYSFIVNDLVNEMIWLTLRADSVSDLSCKSGSA